MELRHWDRPHAVTTEGPACAVNFILPPARPDALELVAIEVIEDRITEVLRRERGLTYDLDVTMAPILGRRWCLAVEVEPPDDRIAEAVRNFIQVIGGLLSGGRPRGRSLPPAPR